MLKLGAESGWKNVLPGVRVRFAPIGIKVVRAARIACGMTLRDTDGDYQEASDALSREILRRTILEWEGVGDANGDPITPMTAIPIFGETGDALHDAQGGPLTEPAVELFLRDLPAFEAAERLHVHPFLFRDMEKNGSAVSSTGTSAAGTVEVGTAKRSATRGKRAGANPTQKPRARKSA